MAKTEQLILDITVKNQRALGKLNQDINRLQKSSLSVGTALKGFIAVLSVQQILKFGRAIANATNEFQNFQNSLRLVTNSQKELDETYSRLIQIAKDNRSSVAATVDLYSKLSVTTADLGVSQEDIINVTSKFSRALAISGADAGTAAGVIRQFGQAMASGTVRGDEFNSIVEALGPALAIMAKESGLNVGELRKLSREGKLTADVFFNMVKNATAIDDAFNKTKTTTGQLETAFGDAFDRMLVKIGEVSGFTETYNGFLSRTVELMDQISGTTPTLEDLLKGDDASATLKEINKQIIQAEQSIEELQNATGPMGLFNLNIDTSGEEQFLQHLINLRSDYMKILDLERKKTKELEQQKKKEAKATADNIKADKERMDSLRALHGTYEDLNPILESQKTLFDIFGQGFKNEMLTQETLLQQVEKAGANTYNKLTDAVTDFVMTGKLDFNSFARSVIADLVRIAAQAAITFAIKAALKALGGPVGGFISGFLADGGTAQAGRSYIVGERGPELFVPRSTGTVVPNEAMGAAVGGEVNVNFNINAVDAAGFDELLLSRKNLIVGTIQQAFRQQGRRLA